MYYMCMLRLTWPVTNVDNCISSSSSSSWSIVHKLQWTETPVHGYGTSADGRWFFKNVGDQIVTRSDETIT